MSIPHLAGGWGVDGLKTLTVTLMTCLLLNNNNPKTLIMRAKRAYDVTTMMTVAASQFSSSTCHHLGH